MEAPTTGWLETQAERFLGQLPKFLLDPKWGLVLAAMLSFVGPSELTFRSLGLTAIALSLSGDIWAWALRKRVEKKRLLLWTSWKFVIGWSGTSLLLIVVMVTMWWGLSKELEVQEQESFDKLTATIKLPPSGDPVGSIISIQNGGHFDINDHQVLCRINYETFENHLIFTYATNWIISKPMLPIRAGGDTESVVCLDQLVGYSNATKKTGAAPQLQCADITFQYDYAISTLPSFSRSKAFRFVTRNAARKFDWYPETCRAIAFQSIAIVLE